ncbi:MAG: ATP-binding protein [Candidatus Aenigmarchaeota archaeon]|nr:ATP-binding protein [Candidatus Aenigmarchaeota archaeon]
MEDIDVLKILSEYNPWWVTNEVPKEHLQEYHRRSFFTLQRELDDEKITAILGPRRVGKTVLLYQLIKYLLNQGVPSKNIFFLSMDQDKLKNERLGIKDVLETYFKLILKIPMGYSTSKTYVFLDEIQASDGWYNTLKNLWDLKYNLKFVVSGSSTMAISKGAMESLLGRVTQFIVLPFKFSEVLEHDGVLDKSISFALRNAFSESISKGDPKVLYNLFSDTLSRVISDKDKIEINLDRYLMVGGYPEFLKETDDNKISKITKEKLKFTFYQDIVRFYKLRNAEALDALFYMISSTVGTKFNISNTARDLDIERPTVKSYLKYLEDIFLISGVEFYSKSRRSRYRKNRKLYITDVGVRNSVLGKLGITVFDNPAEMGVIAECFAFDHLKRLKFILGLGVDPGIFYWKNSKEVDFILDIYGVVIPIEVKYQNSVSVKDTGLPEFISKFDSSFGILLSKDTFDIAGKIIIIPMWLFFLMV